ncbi:hypothetical protein HZC27_00480 [Candidatus Roizmanbacteria bacterium]|nr:hypothetical protein [Candidatus Roizmanbacteria bacterium]
MSLVKKQMVVLLCFLLFVASLIFANKYIKALQGPLSPAHAEAFAEYKKNFSSLLALPGVQAGENNIKLTVLKSKGAFGLGVITAFQDPGKYLTIPSQYSKPMRVQKDGYWVEFTPAFSQPLNNVTAEVLKSTIIYPGILPDVDIVQHVMPYGIKEDIVIKGKDAPTFYQWKMALDPRLVARIEHNYVSFYKKGSLLPTETTSTSAETNFNETKMFEIAPPFLMDTKGNKYFQAYTALNNNIYTLSIEKKWLEKLNSYPLVLDPTILHNSSANFATGTNNRSWDEGSGAAPLLITSYHELAADINTVGLWHMNEASGNLTDSSGNGFTGTVTGTTVVAGRLGNGRQFTANTNVITSSTSTQFDWTLNGNTTIEGWYYWTATPGTEILAEKWDASNGWTFYTTGTYLQTVITSGGANTANINSNTFTWPLNQWVHLALVKSGTNYTYYLNGQNIGGTTTSGAIGASANALVLGKRYNGTANTFTGTMDEVRISNIARTPEEIKQDSQRFPYSVYTSPVVDLTQASSWTDLTWLAKGIRTGDGETPISTSGLIAQWNFNETSGVTAASGGTCGATCNGTLSGFASTGSQDAAPMSGWTANNKRWGAGALMFDGSNDQVSMGDPAGGVLDFGANQDFTLSAWERATPIGGTIIDKAGSASGDVYGMWISGDSLCSTINSTNQCVTAKGVTDGSWRHIVITFARTGNASYYIDGKLMGTNSISANNVDLSSTGNLYFGRWSSLVNHLGVIDMVSIYSRVLTAPEILANYQAGNIEFQTRTSADNATWEAWKPTNPTSGVDVVVDSIDVLSPIEKISQTSLTAYWKLDETSGTRADSKGSNTLTDNNTVMYAPGRIANSAHFLTANTEYLSIADNTDLSMSGNTSFTFTVWAYWDTVNPSVNRGIFGKLLNGANGYEYGLYNEFNPARYRFLASTTGTNAITADSTSLITAGKWDFLVVTYDGANIRLYLNNILEATTPFTGSIIDGTAPFLIGRPFGTSATFDGKIDEVSVWKRALTTGEITQLYQDGLDIFGVGSGSVYRSRDTSTKFDATASEKITLGSPQVDAYTTALWHLDETSGAGAFLKDSAGTNHLSIGGGTTTSVQGFYGRGRYFNGASSEYLTVADSSAWNFGGNDFSIDFWMNAPSAPANDKVIIGRWSDWYGGGVNGYPGWGVQLYTSGTVGFWEQAGSGYGDGCGYASVWSHAASSLASVADGKWHHVAFSKTGSTGNLYVDGVYNSNTTGYSGVCYQSTNLNIGKGHPGNPDSTQRYYTGSVDEIRIKNGSSMSAEEIAEAYRAGRDHRISKTITSTNLSTATKLPFYVASDRPGTFLEATAGESPFANYEPDANTVGLWHLEEQTGSGAYLKDSSGLGNHASIGSGTSITQGKLGKGRNFNGTSDYLTAPDSANWDSAAGDYTYEFWMYPTKTPGEHDGLVGQHLGSGNGNPRLGLYYYSDKRIWFYNYNQNIQVFSIATPPLNQWSHVVLTKNTATSTMYMYINGALDNTVSIAGATSWTDLAYPLYIGYGRGSSAAATYFGGTLDEIRLSKGTARSADEVRQAYEYGRRTHPITIDFVTSPQAAYASGTSVTINNPYGTTALTSTLAVGDTIIFKENVGGTETVSQATVTSVTNTSTTYGTVVLASAPTFPSGGFSTNAKVFKWQREYMDLTGSLTTQRDAITRLTLRVTDGSQGANVWLDDFRSNTGYITGNTPTSFDTATGVGTYTNTGITSTLNRYFQYRAINSSWDTAVSPSLTSVAINYSSNTTPGTPTITAPTNGATSVAIAPAITLSATDTQSDYLRYKIQIATDNAFTVGLQTFDETASQTGWSGQNAQTSTAYNSGSTATYTLQANLAYNQLYYVRSYAIDPGGSNSWSSPSTTGTFTTIPLPAPTNCQISATVSTGPAIVTWTDNLSIEDNYYIESSLNGGAWSAPTTLAANTITSSQTVATGTYQYRVRASVGGIYTAYCTTGTVVFPLQSMRFEGVRMEGVQIK